MDVRGVVMREDGHFVAVPIVDIKVDLDAQLWNEGVTPTVDKMGTKSLPMAVRFGDAKGELVAFVAA